jgi:FkbM family methyltransferase
MVSEIFGTHCYDQFPEFEAGKGELVLDAGAHIGVFSVLCGMECAEVIALESEQQNFSFLIDNRKANRLRNVTQLNVA